LTKKISDKDIKDWENFISNKEKLQNKDLLFKKKNPKKLIKSIDLHGYGLESANKIIYEYINECFQKNVTKIIVITGKGLRSSSVHNPYVSKDLGILKYSVPEFIESNTNLMKMIKYITDAKIEDGGSGAFYVYIKNKLKNK